MTKIAKRLLFAVVCAFISSVADLDEAFAGLAMDADIADQVPSAHIAAEALPVSMTSGDAGSVAAAGVTKQPSRALFGNMHIHTRWSFDAAANGSLATPSDAYRWAKGAVIGGENGVPPMQALRPLDWFAVSEHGEYLGVMPLLADPNSAMGSHPLAKALYGGDQTAAFDAYQTILSQISYSSAP